MEKIALLLLLPHQDDVEMMFGETLSLFRKDKGM
jgi:hypothetical protein